MPTHVFVDSRQQSSCRWFPPSSPLLEQRWDAETFVHGLQERGEWLALENLGVRIREGERLEAAEAHRLGLYRPSCIRRLALDDGELASMPTTWGKMSTIGPGDVVVSKFLPVDAAWVAPSTARRPIDANCVRVVGLQDETGFWIANVFEQPAYQTFLARRGSGAALPRLGLRDLRALRVPVPPCGLAGLVLDWSKASRRRASADQELRRLRHEVNAWAVADAPALPDPRTPRLHTPTAIGASWAPAHAALQIFQTEADRRGWRSLGELFPDDSQRLRSRVAALRVLRLSDTDGAFGFDLPKLAELQHPSFRIYGHPLEPDEVLLSVLGSSPKVVLNSPSKSSTVWLSDHWVRFRGLSAPGSLALLLGSPAVTSQLGLAVTGAARQFVPRADLAEIRIPRPETGQAGEWHDRLAAALKERAAANAELDRIRAQVAGLIDECLGRPQ